MQALGGNSFKSVEEDAVVGSEIRLNVVVVVVVVVVAPFTVADSFVSFVLVLSPLPTIFRNWPIFKKLSIIGGSQKQK